MSNSDYNMLNDMPHSIILSNVTYQQIVNKSAILLYAPTYHEKVHQIIGKELPISDHIQIVKNQQQQLWITKCCKEEQKYEMDQIERLIGLTMTIICIEISNHLQSVIEKSFSLLLSSIQTDHPIKLIFVKSIYQNKPHTIEIKYCENISQAQRILSATNILNTRPIHILHLIQIFDCQLPESVAKVRQAYQNYQAIKSKQDQIQELNKYIFEGTKQKGYILQQLQKIQANKYTKNKLMWKLQRLNRYKQWLEQQKANGRIDCSQLTFKTITSKINHSSIAKYGNIWASNSFAYLKQCFNKISNRSDTNSIKFFIGEYQLMRNHLLEIQQDLEGLPYGHAITKMREELTSFYQYHHRLIQGSAFSFIPYLKAQMSYLWKYNNSKYKKIGAFMILVAFAYTQGNFIKAVTILLIAMIVLALRC